MKKIFLIGIIFLAVLAIALLTKIMNKKILLVLGVVLLIVAATFVFNRINRIKNNSNNYQAGDVSVPSDVPSEYRALYSEKIKWLEEKLVEWKPVEYKPMDFDVYHVQASDNIFVKTNSDIDTKMLDAILEVDPDTVLLYIRPKEYFSQKERYDKLINKIRNSEKKLFIGARFDDIKMSFSDYDKALSDYTKNITAVIKPDYYGIVIEPETMGRKYNFKASDSEWKGLVGRIAELSKQLSPGTKTVAAGHKEELSFLRIASDIKDLDIIGFDIYGMEGIYSEYSGYLGKGDVVGDAIDYANSKGKETWMLETWTSAMINDQQRAMSIKEFMKPIDAKWIRLMAYYAQKHNMSAIVPFYTGKFVYYGSDQNEFVSALNNKQRTPAFESYKSVIEEIRNKKQSETKDEANSIVNINKDEMIDNEDGECWIKEGAIYETHPYYYPNHSFKEITQQIPSLADLGIKIIYLMPIWEHEPLPSEENKFRYGFIYHIIDYYKISTEFGTEEELKEMIATAHKYDMKIIFDLVTCCTPEDSIIYNNGWTLSMPLSELQGKVSKLEYTKIRGNDYVYSNCTPPQQNVIVNCDIFGRIMNDKVIINFYPFPGFGYTIDKTNPEVINYFTQVTKYYAKEFNIDGWRVDAPQNSWNADIISGDHSINKLLRSIEKELKMNKPDTILFLESSAITPTPNEDIPDPVLDETSDISYSYYFYNKLKKLLAENANSEELVIAIINEKIWYGRIRSYFVENHDQPRINNRFPHLNRPLLVLITTISGVPMIQAGQEIGATNMFLSEAPVIWSKGDYELRAFYKKVFEIRNRNEALKYGDIKNVWKSGDNIYAYSRIYENETAVVVINFNGNQAESVLDIPFNKGNQLTNELSGEIFNVGDPANFNISVPAYDSRILTIKR